MMSDLRTKAGQCVHGKESHAHDRLHEAEEGGIAIATMVVCPFSTEDEDLVLCCRREVIAAEKGDKHVLREAEEEVVHRDRFCFKVLAKVAGERCQHWLF